METVDLDMGELFETEAGDDVGAFGDAGEDQEGREENGENVEATQGEGDVDVLERLRDLSKGAAKKKTMRPQPKLNADRLKGDRGLAVLPRIFSDVKFKNEKGYEAHNLKMMMGKLEHWGHRVFPKLPFDDFIERMEKLGHQNDVKNIVKRIRLDMPVLDDDYVQQTVSDEEKEDEPGSAGAGAGGGAAMQNGHDEVDDMDAEEAFDEMVRQERQALATQQAVPAQNNASLNISDVDDVLNMSTASAPPATPSSAKKELSAEVKERIERNKRLAMEKKMKRMGITPNKSNPSAVPSSPRPSTSGIASSSSPSPSHKKSPIGQKSPTGQKSPVHSDISSGALRLSESQGLSENLQIDSRSSESLSEGRLQLDTKTENSSPVNSPSKHLVEEIPSKSNENTEQLNMSNTEEESLNLHMAETEDSNLVTDAEPTDNRDIPVVSNHTENSTGDSAEKEPLREIQNIDSLSPGSERKMKTDSVKSTDDELQLKLSMSDDEMEVDEASLDDSVIS